MTPWLSICLPCYERPELLEPCLRSALAEVDAHEDVELVVSDNHSTGGAWELVQDLVAGHPRAHAHRSSGNVGPTANFRRALELASGTWATWLSSDDLLLPGAVAAYRRLASQVPDAHLLTSPTVVQDPDGRAVAGGWWTEPVLAEDGAVDGQVLSRLVLALHENLFGIPAFRRASLPLAAFDALLGQVAVAGDVAIGLHLARLGPVGALAQPVRAMCTHAGARTRGAIGAAGVALDWSAMVEAGIGDGLLAGPWADLALATDRQVLADVLRARRRRLLRTGGEEGAALVAALEARLGWAGAQAGAISA